MGVSPYYEDDLVKLYLGDMHVILPELDIQADLVVADPPYGETPLVWDKWPEGWPSVVARVSKSMWCFGSFRMFMTRHQEFAQWHMSQDVVWEKQGCTGFETDRFSRTHEMVTHWYQGLWRDVYHEVPMVNDGDKARQVIKEHRASANRLRHRGAIGPVRAYVREDGLRQARSVMLVRNTIGTAIHPTEKPAGVLDPLISYGCPPGGLVLDPFAGSASTLETARMLDRRAIGIEAHEPYAEAAALRLSGVPASAINARGSRA